MANLEFHHHFSKLLMLQNDAALITANNFALSHDDKVGLAICITGTNGGKSALSLASDLIILFHRTTSVHAREME